MELKSVQVEVWDKLIARSDRRVWNQLADQVDRLVHMNVPEQLWDTMPRPIVCRQIDEDIKG